MALQLTDEQNAIVAAISGGASTLVQSYAGCAKTTTLVAAAKALSARQPRLKKLAVAFNKKIQKELQERLEGNADWEVRTMNSLGLGTLNANTGLFNKPAEGFVLDENKVSDIVTNLRATNSSIRKWEATNKVKFDLTETLVDLINKAKMFGHRPENLTPEIISALGDVESGDSGTESVSRDSIANSSASLLNAVTTMVKGGLSTSNEIAVQHGVIDFNDQVYLAVLYTKHQGRTWDVVAVDEGQDLSMLNHLQVTRACKQQLIILGDNFQALYGFRGATSESMEDLATLWGGLPNRKAMTRLQLSETFRCPQAVVDRQSRTVGITDFKARGTAGPGTLFLPYISRPRAAGWSFSGIVDRVELRRPDFDAVLLSGTNAPLYTAAALLWQDLRCQEVEEFQAWVRPVCNVPGLHACNVATSVPVFNAQQGVKNPTTLALHYLHMVTGLNVKDMRRLFTVVEQSDPPPITLSTVHRAKGFEWDQVYLLEEGAMGATGNLRYVAETRTRDFLGSLEFEDHWRAGVPGNALQKYLTARSGTPHSVTPPDAKRKWMAIDILKAHPDSILKRIRYRDYAALLAKLERKLSDEHLSVFDPTAFIIEEINSYARTS